MRELADTARRWAVEGRTAVLARPITDRGFGFRHFRYRGSSSPASTAGELVQPVHALRDHPHRDPEPRQLRHCPVRSMGFGLHRRLPAAGDQVEVRFRPDPVQVRGGNNEPTHRGGRQIERRLTHLQVRQVRTSPGP